MSVQDKTLNGKAVGATVDAIAEVIARDIQSGVLVAGQWLKQIDLEQRFAAKRIDVRRALDRLVQKRLIEHLPNRGYHVRANDGQRADDIRDVRLILEVAAVDQIVKSATARDIAKARRLANNFKTLIQDGTVLELYDANLAFHFHMLDLCPNKELVNLVMELRGRLSSAPANQWQSRGRIDQSNTEHFSMVEAIDARNSKRLVALIKAHIMQIPA